MTQFPTIDIIDVCAGKNEPEFSIEKHNYESNEKNEKNEKTFYLSLNLNG